MHTAYLLTSLWPKPHLSPSTTLRIKSYLYSGGKIGSKAAQNIGANWQFVPQQPRLKGSELAQQSVLTCVFISNCYEQGCGRGREEREVGIGECGGG